MTLHSDSMTHLLMLKPQANIISVGYAVQFCQIEGNLPRALNQFFVTSCLCRQTKRAALCRLVIVLDGDIHQKRGARLCSIQAYVL